MAKVKKKLTTAQKRERKKAKAEAQKKYMWVFMNGKQVKIKREPTIYGMDVDEFHRKMQTQFGYNRMKCGNISKQKMMNI